MKIWNNENVLSSVAAVVLTIMGGLYLLLPEALSWAQWKAPGLVPFMISFGLGCLVRSEYIYYIHRRVSKTKKTLNK